MSIDVTPVAPRAGRPAARPAALLLLLPLLLVVAAGIVALWPGPDALGGPADDMADMSGGWFSETLRGTLVVDLEPESANSGMAEVELDSGESILAPVSPMIAGEGLTAGTRLILMHSGSSTSISSAGEEIVDEQYWVQDVDRGPRLAVLAVVGAAALVAAGWWRGLRGLVAVAAVGALAWSFLVPHLLIGDRSLAALALTAGASCLVVALTVAGLSRRAAIIAWAMIAGAAVVGVLAWLVTEYLTLATAASVGSIGVSYLGMGEATPTGLHEASFVLAGLAGLAALVPAQVRLIERPGGAMGMWQLLRGSGPVMQRIVLGIGLFGTAFLLAPALSRRVGELPGVGMQFLADLDIGLALVLTTLLAVALATPLTAAVALALDRRIAPTAGGGESDRYVGPAARSAADVPAAPTEPAERPGPTTETTPAAPGSGAAPAYARPEGAPLGPATAAPGTVTAEARPRSPRIDRPTAPGELRPAPRERPEAAYRRPESE